MRFDTIYTVTPYLDSAPADYPRAVHYQIGHDDRTVRIVSVESDGSEVIRFEAGPYRPSGRSAADYRRMADDIAGFAVAYVQRSEEFERGPEDTEQAPENRAWFYRHSDAITLGLED